MSNFPEACLAESFGGFIIGALQATRAIMNTSGQMIYDPR